MSPFFGGIRVVETPLLVIGPFEDWSQVRSPGRAARRRKRGHKQRIRFYHKPDPQVLHDRANGVIYAHPVTAQRLRAARDLSAQATPDA